ncbi:hypothetical protein BC831DRAFT_217501 [Entophlyctis helioformis]|nr:hypothetical protein BC831DRAFT_217501 [Entophlyctis helioformis]
MAARGSDLSLRCSWLVSGSAARESLDATTAKLAAAKDELKATVASYQSSKTQYQHEIRRCNSEMDKMKQRYSKLISERTPSNAKMTLLNPLTKPAKPVSTVRAKAEAKDEMYAMVIKNYEDRQKETMAENEALRQTLGAVFAEMKGYAEQIDTGHSSPFAVQPSRLEIFRSHSLDDLMQPITEAVIEGLAAIRPTGGEASASEVAALEEKVKKLQKQNEEQMRLLDEMHALDARIKSGELDVLFGGVSDDDTAADVNGSRAELEEQRRKLEEDRRKFTDAAIRMGMERAALQKEKEEFYAEALKSSEQQLVGLLPPTPAWLKTADFEARLPDIGSPGGQTSGSSFRERLEEIKTKSAKENPSAAGHRVVPQRTPSKPASRSTVNGLNMSNDEVLVESETFMTPGSQAARQSMLPLSSTAPQHRHFAPAREEPAGFVRSPAARQPSAPFVDVGTHARQSASHPGTNTSRTSTFKRPPGGLMAHAQSSSTPNTTSSVTASMSAPGSAVASPRRPLTSLTALKSAIRGANSQTPGHASSSGAASTATPSTIRQRSVRISEELTTSSMPNLDSDSDDEMPMGMQLGVRRGQNGAY